MKTKLILFIFGFQVVLHSQSTKKEKSVQHIQTQKNINLTSTKEPNYKYIFPIEIPKNNLEWYYSFTTSALKSSPKSLNLSGQIQQLLNNGKVEISTVINDLKVSPGLEKIDIYLMSEMEKNNFLDNAQFNYYIRGSLVNSSQGILKIPNNLSGLYFIGIRNQNNESGVCVSFEASSIIEKETYIDEWIEDSKIQIKKYCLSTFLSIQSGKIDVCDCIIGKLITDKKPSFWNNLSKEGQEEFISTYRNECFTSTNNLSLKEEEITLHENKKNAERNLELQLSEIQTLFRESYSASQLTDYKEAIFKLEKAMEKIENYSEVKTKFDNELIANKYNSLVWYSILLNDEIKTSLYLKKGLSYDPYNMYLRGNLGLYHIMIGDVENAKKDFDYYGKREKLPNGQKWIDAIKEDLTTLEERKIGEIDFQELREYLGIK